jgi:glycerophosphoryl diester phosphodiesterase
VTVFNLILFIFCILVLIMLFMLWPGKRRPKLAAPFWGFNYAHRGLHTKDKTVPENSLAAFDAAAKAGYGMELDIQLSRDKQVVVFHDDTLNRVCGASGRVDDFTYEELRKLRLHDTDQYIPLFTEILEVVDGRTPLIVELKTSGSNNDELCAASYEILKQYKGDYCVESFDPRIMRWFKKNAPNLLRGQLASPPKDMGMGVTGFLIGTLLCNFLGRPDFIAYSIGKRPFTVPLVESGAMRVAWTARPADDAEKVETENDAVIFEFYEPEPRYKEMEQD